ncbi:MAG: hypothetical protein WBW81_11540, partial [Methylocella sp.]
VFINLIEAQKEERVLRERVDRGADRLRQFDIFARAFCRIEDAIQIGGNFYGSRDLYRGLQVTPAIC